MEGTAAGETRLVRELASDLGITLKEAMALCTVSGVPVKSPETRLTAEQVARVHAVLAGQQGMVVPNGSRAPSGKVILALVAAVGAVVLIGAAVAGVASFVNQETNIHIAAGQCFNDPGLLGRELKAVPCDGPHDYRAEAVLDLREVYGEEYPGQQELTNRAEERCQALGAGDITSGIGGQYLEFYYFYPIDQRAWDSPDARKIVCAVPSD